MATIGRRPVCILVRFVFDLLLFFSTKGHCLHYWKTTNLHGIF